jgi:phosphoenolpyruvate carboxykinase (ATP)
MTQIYNPSNSLIYKNSLQNPNIEISSTGALVAYSGENTGRCPDAKRIVFDEKSKDIDWNANNKIDSSLFNFYLSEGLNKFDENDVYVLDVLAGWDNQLKVRIHCTDPYHVLFMKNMLIPTSFQDPDFEIFNFSKYTLHDVDKPQNPDQKLDKNLVALDFTQMKMIIFGTRYAGEMKKGVLTLIMFMAPIINDLPLHSSCNVGKNKDVTLFFGLSGTGKTTLSTESNRNLIGDDEHVWTQKGVYNIENGNYAKCIGLREESEPEIFNAIKYGAILENVKLDDQNNVLYDDISITQNTRCAYPLTHIKNSIIPAKIDSHPKNIVFLTCDAFGIFPPVSKLTINQAIFFFISGYTSKMPGTEMGVDKPKATFSPCFGGPFLAWHPQVYGELLRKKLEKHKSNIWLINTGWINGKYGVGDRISIKHTRQIVDSIHDGTFDNIEFETINIFDLQIPKSCKDVPYDVLNPLKNIENKGELHAFIFDFQNKFIKKYGRDYYEKLTNKLI